MPRAEYSSPGSGPDYEVDTSDPPESRELVAPESATAVESNTSKEDKDRRAQYDVQYTLQLVIKSKNDIEKATQR